MPNLAKKYIDGSLVIIRLAPADYHRFHFQSAEEAANTQIEGAYYSVNHWFYAK
jgi:phosphatidylserine decarboxylase